MTCNRCAFCGRVTLKPAAYIGNLPVGPTCARTHALAELIAAGGRGAVRAPRTSDGRRIAATRDPRTMDLFEGAHHA